VQLETRSAPEEEAMASKATPPYHLGEQNAAALVQPVAADLADLVTRLGHYASRVPMSDRDRVIVQEAESIVVHARDGVNRLIAALNSRDSDQ
jgi:hypothetical protein